jgi:hypothetical protein
MMMRPGPQSHPGWLAITAAGLLLEIGSVVTLAAREGQIIENPAKPKAANAGRVITPTEVLTISDEGTSDFYFKSPGGLTNGPDRSILLRDSDQILHFDANGKFLRNLFMKGQGPGEMPRPGTPVETEQNVVIYAGSPSKLVYFSPAGRYEKEIAIRTEGQASLSLIGYQAGRFYFDRREFPRTSGDPDFVDNPRTLVAVGEADGSIATLATFVTHAWVVTLGEGGGMFHITSLIARPFQGRFLVLTHTEDYLIKLFDPAANRVVREFRRPYVRIKGEPLGGIFINDKYYTRPERNFENDIKNLLVRNGEIWAVTSTKDRAKGVLIDVFDKDGIYRDCFWLRLPEAALRSLLSPGQSALDGELLWAVERSEDETIAIKRYRVVTSGSQAAMDAEAGHEG